MVSQCSEGKLLLLISGLNLMGLFNILAIIQPYIRPSNRSSQGKLEKKVR
jgi:hypothetical protein